MSDEKKDTEVLPISSYHYFLLNKDIDQSSIGEAMTFVLERNLMRKGKPAAIRLIINSLGGDMNCAFALTDVIDASCIPVWTYGLGNLCSAALTIFIAGTKGKRYITKNTSILSHQFSWGMGGKEHELIASVKEIDLARKRVYDHYKRHTKQSEATIKKYLLPAEDCWLSAKEAIRYGLADVVMSSFTS